MNNILSNSLSDKILNLEFLDLEEALFLWKRARTTELIFLAHQIRERLHPDKNVSWIIDRNINYTNVCYAGCVFCNFHCSTHSDRAYLLSLEDYDKKIEELFELGGDQILLQGGLHPKLGLDYFVQLFSQLKNKYPKLRLHALGPSEIVHLSNKEKKDYAYILLQLREAGLDSLPGAGAEILSNRVRGLLSPNKCSSQEWLDVMETAHQLNMLTTATCMFGHIETIEEHIQHLFSIRDLQAKKPTNSLGFISYIPWPIQVQGTALMTKGYSIPKISGVDYIRTLALSRILLPNISNIQASWLTVGKEVAQICLHAGANDFGSIMIEEQVVSSAGANNQLNKSQIQQAISEAGFTPIQRNQFFKKQS